ncbi:hypothetical protein ABZX93_12510 [Streptomyces sp. NPDC006632]|uniref:hypothetical protein n=1 Tax=Streptomyces sp. NPDC006632 TaxID=3157182 RepID=UPI0033BD0485
MDAPVSFNGELHRLYIDVANHHIEHLVKAPYEYDGSLQRQVAPLARQKPKLFSSVL